jgi:hypothetical protein
MQCTPGLRHNGARRHDMDSLYLSYMHVKSHMDAGRIACSIQAEPEQATHGSARDQMVP